MTGSRPGGHHPSHRLSPRSRRRCLWWWLPKWRVNLLRLKIRDPKARADVEDNFRKTIGQLLGGAAVLIGTGFAYYQSQLTIISQQVSKGFEQLGSDKIVVRLGGIYALEGVMNTSEQYHQPVLEGLCAFVRDGTKTDTGQRPPATDIQAALTVIGRRAGTGVVDLNGSHVSKAKLSLANLREADLRGADLSFAALFLADLRGADLSFAHLEITNVTQSQLDKPCSDRGTHLPSGLTIKPCKAIHP
jgi:Pentapeptide repeats (8 copies)